MTEASSFKPLRRSPRLRKKYYDAEGNRTVFYNETDVAKASGFPWHILVILIFAIIASYCFSSMAQKKSLPEPVKADLSKIGVDLSEMKKMFTSEGFSLLDFADKSQDAQIVTHLCSDTRVFPDEHRWTNKNAPWLKYKTPNTVITENTFPLTPSYCWPMDGESGQLVVKLATEIHITHVTLGHITKSQAPFRETPSAPKRFTVYGVKTLEGEEVKLGTFEYDNDGVPFQTFKIQAHTDETFEFVRLKVENNYGNPDYTCLYRFMVHGQYSETERV